MKEGQPQNYSVYRTEGELTPTHVPMERMERIDELGAKYYKLRNHPEKQFIVSQLASLVMPVANVFKKDTPTGTYFFSPDARNHPDYIACVPEISRSNQLFLRLVLKDFDHSNNHNHEGSIMYDFDQGMVKPRKTNWSDYIHESCVYILENDSEPVLTELISKIHTFKTHIEGEEGLRFITAVVEHAAHTEEDMNPKLIQEYLIERCDVILSALQA